MLVFERRLFLFLRSRHNDFDCIHACDFDTGYVASRISAKYEKKLVYDIFDYFSDSRIMPKLLKAVISKMENSVVSRANATIICTEQRRIQIAEAHPKRIVVIENTPVARDFQSEKPAFDDKVHLSYTGTFSLDRYIEEILEAVRHYDDLWLDIAGFGRLEDLVVKASEECERIRYHGKVDHERALRIEAGSDVIIALYDPKVPNNKLAAPNKFYEGLMLGVPLVTVRGTSVADWVEELGTGRAVSSSFETSEFYDAVKTLTNNNRDNSITLRSKELYKGKYDWANMAERLRNLYATL